MFKSLRFAVILFWVLVILPGRSQTIVQFHLPYTPSNMAYSTAPPTGVSCSNLSQTGMTSIGNGTGCSSTSRCNVSSWSSATGSNATTYLRFTLTVAAGYTLNLSTISILHRRTAAGPDAYEIDYNANSSGAVNAGSGTVTTTCNTAASVSPSSVTVTAGNTLVVTVYYWYVSAGTTGNLDFSDLTVTGTVTAACSAPSTQASGVSTSAATSGGFNAAWSGAGNGNADLAVVRATANANTAPTVGTAYTPNIAWASAGQIDANNRVVFGAAGTSVSNLTGLNPQTQYTVNVYAYNTASCYDLTSPPTASVYTLSNAPTTHTTGFGAAAGCGSVKLTWTGAATYPGSGANNTGYIILQRTDGTNPTATGVSTAVAPASLALTLGTTLAANVTSGATLTTTINGLTGGQAYNYCIIPYTWDGTNAGTYNYYTAATIPTANATAISIPTVSASIGSYGITTQIGTIVNWTNGNGDRVIVLAVQGGSITQNPVSGTSYTGQASSTFGNAGAQIGVTGTYVIYDALATAGTTVAVSGLTAGKQYTFAVYAYNSGSNCYQVTGSASTFTTIPPCASYTSPANNATNQVLAPTLQWGAASGATGYDIYLDQNTTPVTLVSGNQGTTSYAPGSNLISGASYYWMVVPRNATGSAAAYCSTVWKFTIGTPPSCTTNSTPANNATGVASGTALVWNSAGTATSYDVYWANGTPVNITNTASTTYTPTYASAPQPATTYSWYVVPRNAIGAATGCSANTTTYTVPIQYCTAAGGNAASNHEYISQVTVGSISQSSSYTVYTDYSANVTNMVIGTGYPISITDGHGFSNDKCFIWVDWNQNGTFGDMANEIITMTNGSGVGPYTATITPPGTALTGTARMRIRIEDSGGSPANSTSCGTSQYGEVEDYSVNVGTAPAIITQPVNRTVCANIATSFTVATSASSPTYQWQMSADGMTWTNVANSTPSGVSYTGTTSNSLGVTGTAAVSAYYYQCIVTAAGYTFGSSTSSAAVIVINPAATAVSASSNSAICAGTTLNLTGSASGATTYSWSGPNGFTSSSQTFTQANFNTLGTSTINPWVDNSTLPGWYASNGNLGSDGLNAGTGSGSTGGNYNFGPSGANPRAFGSLPSGSAGTVYYGVKITNTTGQSVSNVSVSYTGEQWKDQNTSGSPEYLYVDYSTNNTSGSLPGVNFTNVSSLTFTAPSASNVGQMDGTLSANQANISNSITLGTPLANGSSIWIMWRQPKATSGASSALAITNVSVVLGSPNASIPNATTAATGTYTLTASNSYGCSATNTTNVSVAAQPAIATLASASPSNGSTICVGYNGPSVTITAGTGGVGSADTYTYSINNGGTTAAYTSNTAINSTGGSSHVIVYAARSAGTATGCAAVPTTVIASWPIVAQPALATLASASPANGATICVGYNGPNANITAGAGGVGSTDAYTFSINNGSTTAAYISGNTINSSGGSGNVIVYASRSVGTGTGCNAIAATALATWPVAAQPGTATLASASPSTGTTLCVGYNGPSATITAGTGGVGSSDTYTYSINNGGTTAAYTSGNNINSTGGSGNVIVYAARSAGTATGCAAVLATAIATWPIVAQPSVATLASASPANGVNICVGYNGPSATITSGTGGVGSFDTYTYSINNGGTTAGYSSGLSINTTGGSGNVIVYASRSAGTALGCNAAPSAAIATWPLVAQPSLPTLASATPSNATSICIGDNGPSATITAGGGGVGANDTYTFSINGGSTTAAYTSTTNINTASGSTSAIVYASRSAGTGTGCNAVAATPLASWPLVAQPTVTAQPVATQTVCAGGTVTLTAKVSGTGNYTYQWYYNNTTNSNSGGTAIGTGTGVVASGGTASYPLSTTNVAITSPGGTGVAGTFYYYCTFSPLNNTGCGPVTTNAAEVVVNPIVTPLVSIVSGSGTSVCVGTSVTFTAAPTFGGTSPSYAWKKNGSGVGLNQNTYTDAGLANGDVISCNLISNVACPTPSATASSNTIAMTVNPYVSVSVSIDPHPNYLICSNTTLNFTASATNPGGAPVYQWQISSDNGITYGNVGTNSAAYSSNTPINGDLVRCVMISNAVCPTPSATVTSNITAMVVGTCNNTWNGSISTSWDNPANWSAGVVPANCADGANFPPGLTNYPVLTQDEYVGNVILQTGANINLQSHNLSVCQNWTAPTSSAVNVFGTGKLILSGINASVQTITGNTNVYELNLYNTGGGSAALAGGSKVNITNAVDLQQGNFDVSAGTLTFKSASPTQIAVLDNFSTGYAGTISGSIVAERYYAPATYIYTNQHEMGLPVQSVAMTALGGTNASGYVIPSNCNEYQVANNSPYGKVFSYHENAPGASTCGMAQWYVEPGTSVVQPGQGYSVSLINSGTLAVKGAANLNASYTISGNNSSWSNSTYQHHQLTSGWQFVANPYLAALVLNTSNTGMDAQVQVWQANGGFAGTYQPGLLHTVAIAPFQGFMVHVTNPGSANYTISGADRRRNVPATFYSLNANELDITAENLNTNLLDKTIVAFNSSASDSFDTDYDANKFAGSNNRHTLYTTLANGKWMGINTLNSVTTTSTVPMGFEPGATGNYRFSFGSINSFDPTTYIMLEDKKLGTMYNVRNGDYMFSADSSDDWDRFVLHFTPPAIVGNTDATCSSLGSISVTQPGTANWNYTLTDNNNATVAAGVLNQNNSMYLSAPAGTYTLTLVDNNHYTVTEQILVNGTQPVNAIFAASATAVTAQTPVSFNNTSLNANSFSWNFGDGATSNLINPVHTYVTPGNYDVVMTTTNTSGCISTMDELITVNAYATGISIIRENGIGMWSDKSTVYVDFSKADNVNAVIKIYNVLGQELSNDKFTLNGLYEKQIENIDAAYLIVSVNNDYKITTKKLFINNIK